MAPPTLRIAIFKDQKQPPLLFNIFKHHLHETDLRGERLWGESGKAFDASTVDQKALKVAPAGIDIAYQRGGNSDGPVSAPQMGLGGQCIHWPDGFCNALVNHCTSGDSL